MDDLRQRLDDIKLRSRCATPALPTARPIDLPSALDEVLGGAAFTCGEGACWRIETVVDYAPTGDTLTCSADLIAAKDPLAVAAESCMVIDIETGGFAGTPVFLIGVLFPGPAPRILQFLARDYPEERAILQALIEVAGGCTVWVSFNGRSFDEPFLRDRAAVHRLALPAPAQHVDVLHIARRRWKGQLADFRLTTLESSVLGRPRIGDIRGSEAPDLFHHFVRTGNARPLRPIIEHNRMDLLASWELLVSAARA